MSVMFSVNYFIFSIFFLLFGLEAGIAITLLLEYEKYKERLKRFIMPLWEITGTFAVFYIVNFEATFPKLLLLVGSIFIAPVLVAAIFFILRNAFLSYSEYMGESRLEHLFLRIYSVSTIIVAFLVISVLDSGISGIGISMATYSLSMLHVLFNSFNILMFVGIALIAIFIAAVFFEIMEYKWLSFLAPIFGIIAIFIAVYSKLHFVYSNAVGFGLPYLVALIVLLAAVLVCYWKHIAMAKYAAIAWFLLAVNFFGFMQQPYLFGGAISTSEYLAAGPVAFYVNMVTAIGGALLVASLGYFIYISYIKKSQTP